MKRLTPLIILVGLLSGCATGYKEYAAAMVSVEKAKAEAQTAKYNALASIAKDGSDAAKVAVAMGLALGHDNGNGSGVSSPLRAPEQPGETAYKWLSLILPSAVQVYGINANARIATTQSNNAAQVAMSTNEAFVGMAGHIQAPPGNNTTTNTTTTDSHDVSTVTDDHSTTDDHTTNPATIVPTTLVPTTQVPATICTIDGTGALVCN